MYVDILSIIMEECNTSKLYRDQNHRSDVFNTLRQKRTDPFFHNVNLLVDDIQIPTNKMLLAASSPYFLTMFSSNFPENKEKNVLINGIRAEILTLIIDYVYTSEILITVENVEDLLTASHLLQFDSIHNESVQFLKEQILPTNCLGIRAIADSYGFPDLVNDIQTFIDENFKDVIKSEEFLLLPVNEVCSLISRDELRVPTEEDVLKAAIAWIDHDIASRKQQFLLLLKNIRFCYLPEKYVREMFLNHRLFRDNPESYAYAKAAVNRFFPIVERPVRLTVKRRRYENLILLVAGGMMESSKTVQYYCFKKKTWSKLADMPIGRYRAGATVLNGKVYIAGGIHENRVDIYDAATDRWIPSIGMQFYRQYLGVATLKNCIYAIGGHGAGGSLNTVEKFDPETEKWNTVAPMLTARTNHGVGVIDDILYAVGGYDGSYLNSVESYNSKTNTWTYVKSMNSKRSNVGVGVLNGMLYAVGGHDRSSCLKSAEVFNPKTDNWTMIKDMHNPRRNAAVVAANDLLYVIGGVGELNNYTSVEVYDPKTMTWTKLPNCMNIGRHCHWAAILDRTR